MSTDVLYFSFSRSVLLLARARSLRSRACRFFEKSEKKNKTTSEYRLRTKLFFMRIMQKMYYFVNKPTSFPWFSFFRKPRERGYQPTWPPCHVVISQEYYLDAFDVILVKRANIKCVSGINFTSRRDEWWRVLYEQMA